jgi:hypothetical protein
MGWCKSVDADEGIGLGGGQDMAMHCDQGVMAGAEKTDFDPCGVSLASSSVTLSSAPSSLASISSPSSPSVSCASNQTTDSLFNSWLYSGLTCSGSNPKPLSVPTPQVASGTDAPGNGASGNGAARSVAKGIVTLRDFPSGSTAPVNNSSQNYVSGAVASQDMHSGSGQGHLQNILRSRAAEGDASVTGTNENGGRSNTGGFQNQEDDDCMLVRNQNAPRHNYHILYLNTKL